MGFATLKDVLKDRTLVEVEILHDFLNDGDSGTAVPSGTIVEAYTPDDTEYIVEAGEVWYIRPDTGEDWMSFPGDYRRVR